MDKYTSIESFAHVTKNAMRGITPPVVTYLAKVKLHGTHADVVVHPDGKVEAQSRSRVITVGDDNAGFAAWVAENEAVFRRYAIDNATTTFIGEWAGSGIQKTDAVTKLNRKYFFIFAVKVGEIVESRSEILEAYVPELDAIVVIPTFEKLTINFNREAELHDFVNRVTEEVNKIGENDPFIYDMFGVEGPGEGLVYAPISVDGKKEIDRDEYSKYIFKVKTEAHGAKKAKVASVALEIPENVRNFVEVFVTEARCEQGLTEGCNGVAEKSQTSNFLKWLGNDIRKESVEELAEMGKEWKDVAGLVSKAGATWFINRCDKI